GDQERSRPEAEREPDRVGAVARRREAMRDRCLPRASEASRGVSRRRLLQSAGGVFVASAFRTGPGFAAADAAEVSDVLTTLGKLQYMFESHRSTHGIAGNFVAAAAAGCAAGLNTQQMRWLLSYAAQQASGLASWQRDVDHIEKAFDFGGMAARNGVTAALLVQAGGTGVDDILSGADNFFQGFVPKNNPRMVVEELGTRFEIMRTDIKKWTVGAPIQAPLDALDTLIKS